MCLDRLPAALDRRIESKTLVRFAASVTPRLMLTPHVAPPLTSTGSDALLRELIKIYSRNQSHAALFNYASMVYNNMFYFRGLVGVPVS
jgi:hypothetical protein